MLTVNVSPRPHPIQSSAPSWCRSSRATGEQSNKGRGAIAQKANDQDSSHTPGWQLSALQGGFTLSNKESHRALRSRSRGWILPTGGMTAGRNSAYKPNEQTSMLQGSPKAASLKTATQCTLLGGLKAATQKQAHGASQHRGVLQGGTAPAGTKAPTAGSMPQIIHQDTREITGQRLVLQPGTSILVADQGQPGTLQGGSMASDQKSTHVPILQRSVLQGRLAAASQTSVPGVGQCLEPLQGRCITTGQTSRHVPSQQQKPLQGGLATIAPKEAARPASVQHGLLQGGPVTAGNTCQQASSQRDGTVQGGLTMCSHERAPAFSQQRNSLQGGAHYQSNGVSAGQKRAHSSLWKHSALQGGADCQNDVMLAGQNRVHSSPLQHSALQVGASRPLQGGWQHSTSMGTSAQQDCFSITSSMTDGAWSLLSHNAQNHRSVTGASNDHSDNQTPTGIAI